MKTVIFDLDGTLADTSGDLLAAANFCFRDMGHGEVLDIFEDAGVAMRGARHMLRHGLEKVEAYDPILVDKYYPMLLDAYMRDIDSLTYLYPGAMEAVESLKIQGYSVGICTNKPEGLAEMLLYNLGIRGEFASLVGAGTIPQVKPDPAPLLQAIVQAGGDPGQAILVGDTITDHDTARAAGTFSVLVTFGPNGDDMAALQPDALLHHFDHLPEIAVELIT
ncbi:MAG: HAD-IA family hydrolase [Pseudomonadota bacterium]